MKRIYVLIAFAALSLFTLSAQNSSENYAKEWSNVPPLSRQLLIQAVAIGISFANDKNDSFEALFVSNPDPDTQKLFIDLHSYYHTIIVDMITNTAYYLNTIDAYYADPINMSKTLPQLLSKIIPDRFGKLATQQSLNYGGKL